MAYTPTLLIVRFGGAPMQTTMLYIGADVAKAELVISVAGERLCTIANTTAGITR